MKDQYYARDFIVLVSMQVAGMRATMPVSG